MRGIRGTLRRRGLIFVRSRERKALRTTGHKVMLALPVVVLRGEIDIYTAATACRVLDEIDGPAVIDLSAVRLLCAAGLTELARVARRVGPGKVALSGARAHVRRVLDIARFDVLFIIDDGSLPRQP